jgi:hypothetical protein
MTGTPRNFPQTPLADRTAAEGQDDRFAHSDTEVLTPSDFGGFHNLPRMPRFRHCIRVERSRNESRPRYD